MVGVVRTASTGIMIWLLLCSTMCSAFMYEQSMNAAHKYSIFYNKNRWQPAYKVMYATSNFFKEFVYLHCNLFSIDSIKVITGFLPFYMPTRMIDETIHNHFYDPEHHKNIHQMNDTFTQIVEKGAFVGIIGLSSLAFWAPRADVRTTARIFAIGALSGLYLKDFIKYLKTNNNLRPWNEHFSNKKRSYGGFPSGHMFEAAYMTTVWGMSYGLRAYVPLSFFSAAMFAVSVNANRHYVSQVVAGAALGILYGIAAHKTIKASLYGDLWYLDVCLNQQANPIIQIGRSY